MSKGLSFVQPSTDLHLTDCSVADEDVRGVFLPEVPFDYDGEERDPVRPFMGADETDGELPGLFDGPVRYQAGTEPWQIAAGDFDGDLATDLIMSNRMTGSNDVSILWNDGSGTFSEPSHLFLGNDPHAPKTGLLDADNLPDLIITTGDSAFMRLNLGGRNFGPPVAIPPATEPGFEEGSITDLAIADLDNDGDADILAGNHLTGLPPVTMQSFLNDGSGVFARD